jgi:hypothetical protein
MQDCSVSFGVVEPERACGDEVVFYRLLDPWHMTRDALASNATDTGRPVARVDTNSDADDLFYDPANKRIYV